MMAAGEKPVLIIGAGLSGLTLAQGLKKVSLVPATVVGIEQLIMFARLGFLLSYMSEMKMRNLAAKDSP